MKQVIMLVSLLALVGCSGREKGPGKTAMDTVDNLIAAIQAGDAESALRCYDMPNDTSEVKKDFLKAKIFWTILMAEYIEKAEDVYGPAHGKDLKDGVGGGLLLVVLYPSFVKAVDCGDYVRCKSLHLKNKGGVWLVVDNQNFKLNDEVRRSLTNQTLAMCRELEIRIPLIDEGYSYEEINELVRTAKSAASDAPPTPPATPK